MLIAIMFVLALQSPRSGTADPIPNTVGNGVSLMPGATRLAYADGLPVLGTLVFPDGVPPHFIEIELEAEDGTVVADTKSGPNGKFRFDGVKLGNYYFVIAVEGLQPVRQTFQLNTGSFGSASVTIPLRTFGSSGPVGEDIINIDALRKKIHKDAVKALENAFQAQGKGDLDKFKSELEKALNVEPDFYEANLHLGLYLRDSGETGEAIRALASAARLNPASVRAHSALGPLYYDAGEFQKAVDELHEATRLGDTSAHVYFILGSAYYRLDEFERAESNLLRAIAVATEPMASAHLQLHNVYMRNQEGLKALDQLEIFLETFPDDPSRDDIESRAKRLRTAFKPGP